MREIIKRVLTVVLLTVFIGSCLTFNADAAKVSVGRVSNLRATQTTSSITLSWKKASNANGYRIMKKVNGKWKEHGTTKSTSYIVTGLSSATKHTFSVKAYNKSSNKTVWAEKGKTITTGTRPKNTSNLKATVKNGSIKLTWNKVTRATGYKIYEYNDSVGKWTPVAQTVATKYTFKNLATDKSYTFAVRPYFKAVNSTVLSSKYAKYTYTKPVVKKAVSVKTGSSAFSDKGTLIVDIDGSNWNSQLVSNTLYLPAYVDGNATGKNVKCSLSSTPDSAGNYTISIDVSSLRLKSGEVISISFPEGFIQTKSGTQYSKAFEISSTY